MRVIGDGQQRAVAIAVAVGVEFDGAQGREKRNFDPKEIRAAVQPKVGDTVLYKMPSSGYRTVLAKGTFQGIDEKGNAKIGFEAKQLDGKLHKLAVRMKKPGMSARARRSYMAVKKDS